MTIDAFDPPRELIGEIAAQSARAPGRNVQPLLSAVQRDFPQSLSAVLLYGSCLWQNSADDAIADLLIVVRDYRNAHARRFDRWLNAALPPNVVYFEAAGTGGTLRAKASIVSLDHLAAGVSWFHSWLWARLAQPMRLILSADPAVAEQVHHIRARAVLRFFRATLPMYRGGRVDPESGWVHGLRLTYAAELRPEPGDRPARLVDAQRGEFVPLAEHALRSLTDLVGADGSIRIEPGARHRAAAAWLVRRAQGRVLSVLRLAKAAFTFHNGVDYAAWKIHRHTGELIEITPRLRRHPVLFGWVVLWRLVRRGVIK
jgi:hypothetical protein